MRVVTITSGRAIVYRLFDIADEIDLTKIAAGSSRLRIARGGTEVIVRDAPVSIALPPAALRLGSRRVDAELVARAWSYGAVSLQFHIALRPGTTWEELVQLAADAESDNDIDAMAAARLADLQASLAPALKIPHAAAAAEDYIIYFLQSIEGAVPSELAGQVDIPALILGERDTKLSAQTRGRIAANTFAYAEDDLAVIDWNSALLFDPSGAPEVADVLEFALTQLMEFRYFDTILDQRLERLYDEVEKRRPSMFRRGIEQAAREASALYLEFADYAERVENSVKFVGDPFLATIFGAAVARFDLRKWEESVARKLNALARISDLLQSEVNVRRSHWLEIVIIVLILYEILAAAIQLQ